MQLGDFHPLTRAIAKIRASIVGFYLDFRIIVDSLRNCFNKPGFGWLVVLITWYEAKNILPKHIVKVFLMWPLFFTIICQVVVIFFNGPIHDDGFLHTIMEPLNSNGTPKYVHSVVWFKFKIIGFFFYSFVRGNMLQFETVSG